MSSKTVKKTTPPVETIAEQTIQPTTPVVQKAGKKSTKPKSVEAVPPVSTLDATPVETVSVVAAQVEDVPKPSPKKGGAKSKVAAVKPVVLSVEPPVITVESQVGAAVVETPIVATKPKRVTKPKVLKPVVESSDQEGGKQPVVKKQAKKVKAAPKVKEVKPDTEPETDVGNEDSSERRIRSFKVKLPNKEEFEGRFTGLTPYQAANKALSKYFRETEVPKPEITFEICESTRKSKRSVYTYVGKRYQLEVPVRYTIQDGREIVKNFKNSLKKVKKIDLQTTEKPVIATA